MTKLTITIPQLIQTVCIVFQVNPEDFTRKEWANKFYMSRYKRPSKLCPRNVTEAKQIVCYVACKSGLTKEKTKYKQLWQALGYSSHKHVKEYAKTIANRMDVEKDLSYKIGVVEFLCPNSNFTDLLD